MGDAQVAARRMLLEAEDPVLGRHKQLGRPAKFLDGAQDDAEAPAPAPALGQHTNQVLAGLGVGEREIADLRRQGVV